MCIIFKKGSSQKIENSRKMISFDSKIITEECYNLLFHRKFDGPTTPAFFSTSCASLTPRKQLNRISSIVCFGSNWVSSLMMLFINNGRCEYSLRNWIPEKCSPMQLYSIERGATLTSWLSLLANP